MIEHTRTRRPTWPELAGEAVALLAIIAWEDRANWRLRIPALRKAAVAARTAYRAELYGEPLPERM